MFDGKICIITGASSGLGQALALSLASEKAKLVLFSRNESALEQVSQACEQLGAECLLISGDITQQSDCARLIAVTIEKFGRIDYLINNAGVSMWAQFADVTDLTIFEQLMATNYLGAVYCTHYALPYLRQSKGLIVVISSLQGKFPVPFHTGYSAAKHALHGFFETLRIELRQDQVDILMVAPSWLQGTNLRARAFSVEKNHKAFRHRQSKSGMTLEVCCQYIKTAMSQRKRELLLPKKAKILTWVKAIAPQWVDWYIASRVKKELKQ